MVATLGCVYPFWPKSWADLEAHYTQLAAERDGYSHLLAIVRSIREVGADRDLIATRSMDDLILRPGPPPEPPMDLVLVRSPTSMRPSARGLVLIEHQSLNGRDDRIERPVSEAVPLFWRFMIEKFGIDPRSYRAS